MTVELTSPVLGKEVGETYTGNLESWLLAEGYAKQAGYTGVGVSNTGDTTVGPDYDPTSASNREDAPWWPANAATNVTIANDADNLTKQKFPVGADFDTAGVDEAVTNVVLNPTSGDAAGGEVVTITGEGLDEVTSVTFDGVEAEIDASGAVGGEILAVTPAHAAGAVDVVLVADSGNVTLTGGFTYA